MVGFPGAESLDNASLLERPCDILIPAAVGSQIHAGNAERIRALVVAEGANGPTTPEGDVILRERGVTVIPDILCNAGGVVVSYFEWVQGLQYYFWKESEITARLQEVMARDGKVLLLSDAAGIAQAGPGPWRALGMPACEPFVAPIVYAAPVQLLAYHAAMFKGTDVDQPRNLAKSVTVE